MFQNWEAATGIIIIHRKYAKIMFTHNSLLLIVVNKWITYIY